ncbi:hypothetical protein B0T21DRAFT_416398 [Apiosordaria backusii]|uniref:Uncharacterized protein n=1 Tax=Apiosordaria backusii TaxID=314023 RepID=A0AA40A1B0_9PEZI|nr:hypothetical protein B0T21DRAFT_416398 [Apiosordaria backusii]
MPRKEQSRDADSHKYNGPSTVDPRGLAPAWAENRTDLIESLPFFRQAQQGVYQHDKIILGALIDGYGGEHSHFDDDIIITKLDGGGDISIKAYMRHSTSRLEAAQRAKDKQSSIGLIIGSNANNLNLRIAPPKPCRYAVLGRYFLTDLWHEYQDGGDSTVTVVRYQRQNFLEPPWWKSNSAAARYRDQKQRQVQVVDVEKGSRSKVCEACGEVSPKRYKVWVCANPQCEDFSTTENGEVLSKDVPFSLHWLLERVESGERAGLDFAPSRLKGSTLPIDMRKGAVCPKCRKCVSRFHWGSWVCDGPYGCGHRISLPVKIPELPSLLKERSRVFTQPRHPFYTLHDPQNLQREFVSHGTTFIEFQHEMSGGSVVTLLKSRPPRTATPGTIFDDLFHSITWEANHGSYLDLERHPAQNRVTGSRINRYEINFGQKEDPDALPPILALENAPAAVQTVLEMLTEILEENIQDRRMKKEEKSNNPWVLTVTAYVGGDQKEGFKPAGYNTQGDVTATLCLGSPVRVRWRYSPIYWNHSQAGEVLEGSPLPGTKYFEALQEFKGKGLSRGEYDEKKSEILNGSDGPLGRRNEVPTYLAADLTHGDILITQGDIGSHFDSTVEPQGLLHIRLTAFRAQDDDDDRRGRGNTPLRRSQSRSRSRKASSTRATTRQRASSRKRRTPSPETSTPSKPGTRASSRTHRGPRKQIQEKPTPQERESPPPSPVRPQSKSLSRPPSKKKKSPSLEVQVRPNTRTRAAAKEARGKAKTQLRRPESSSSSQAPSASPSDEEEHSTSRQKKPPPANITAPKSILKRTTKPASETISKAAPKITKEDAPQVHAPALPVTETQPLSRRRFVYQTPPKDLVASSRTRGLEYYESTPPPRPPVTKSTARSIDEIQPAAIWQRSKPTFPVPLRQSGRPLIPASIVNPGRVSVTAGPPAFRPRPPTTRHLQHEVSALGVPIPPGSRPRSVLPQDNPDADSHASTGENTPSPDPEFVNFNPSEHSSSPSPEANRALPSPESPLKPQEVFGKRKTASGGMGSFKSPRPSSLTLGRRQPAQGTQHEQDQTGDITSRLDSNALQQPEATRKRNSPTATSPSKSHRVSSVTLGSNRLPLPPGPQTTAIPLESSPPPGPTVNPDLISPSSSIISPRQVHTAARKRSTSIPPGSPNINRQRSLSSSLPQPPLIDELQKKDIEVISISSSSHSTPEPERQGAEQDSESPSSESSSEDDNGASYRVPAAPPSSPERRRTSSGSGSQRLGGVMGVAVVPLVVWSGRARRRRGRRGGQEKAEEQWWEEGPDCGDAAVEVAVEEAMGFVSAGKEGQ